MDENLIYWRGKAVGIESCGLVCWFPSAPREAIDALMVRSTPLTTGGAA